MMRKFESPYVADWFAISLRWLTLLVMVAALSADQQLSFKSAWPLGILVIWNVSMTVMAGLNVRISYHRHWAVLIDTLFTGIFFWTQGGLGGLVPWAGFLPILTTAIYFEIWGGLLISALIAALELAFVFFKLPEHLLIAGGIIAGVTLGIGGLFGFLSFKLINSLRAMRNEALEQEAKKRHSENERLRAIYELTSTLTATLSYRRVLETALDLSVRALNPDEAEDFDDKLVSTILLFVGNQLIVKTSRRFTNADTRVALPGAEGILHKAISDGDPILTQNVGYDPELSRIIALRSCTSAYCVPLRTGFTVYGVLLFAHPNMDYFTPDRRDMLDLISRQAVIAIQNAKLYQDLVEEKERMIDVQEEARKKLARDLHDGPTQSVSAIAMRVNLTRMMLTRAPDKVEAELVRIEELARRTTKEIRHMLFTLRPLVLESQGLTAALVSMAEKMEETYTQKVQVDVNEKIVEQLEMGKQGVIFFIVEEAVNNARKHANAGIVIIRLRQLEPSLILLEVQDNGVGFDVQAIHQSYEKRGSLGMVNLRERAELINGLLHIDSAPGKGTKVQVFIPLTEEAADRLHHAKS